MYTYTIYVRVRRGKASTAYPTCCVAMARDARRGCLSGCATLHIARVTKTCGCRHYLLYTYVECSSEVSSLYSRERMVNRQSSRRKRLPIEALQLLGDAGVPVNRWIRHATVCLNGTSYDCPYGRERPQKPLATGSDSGHLGVSCCCTMSYSDGTQSQIVDLKPQNAAWKLQISDSEL